MKQSKTTQTRGMSNPRSESSRRSPHALAIQSSGQFGQLAATLNGTPMQQPLAELRDDIHQSAQVQNLMRLAAASNQDPPTQMREAMEIGDAGLERESTQLAGPALSALLDELESAAVLASNLAAQAGIKAPTEDML